MEFVSICHEALGDTFNSLFTGKTEAEIYDLTIPEVWAEVERHLSKISVQNPAKLRMLLHTINRDQCSSMKRFTERVFALVKRIKAAGMDISDGVGVRLKGTSLYGNFCQIARAETRTRTATKKRVMRAVH